MKKVLSPTASYYSTLIPEEPIKVMADKENVVTKTQDLIRWFLPKVEKFPRAYKFTALLTFEWVNDI